MTDDLGLALTGQLGGNYLSGRQANQFPDPFFDMASLSMPQSINSALRWCEFLMTSNTLLKSAIGRQIKYFMTDVDIQGEDISDEEKRKFKSYLLEDLNILEECEHERMDVACYGNSFVALVESFTRYVSCPKCRLELAWEYVTSRPQFQYQWTNFEPHAVCPKCEYHGPWKLNDKRGGRDGDLTIKRYSPHEIQILQDPFTRRNAYIWLIPEEYRRMIRHGDPHTMRYAPAEVIAAVKANSNLMFADDYLFHGVEETFAGIRNRGWGLPKILTSFRQAWYVQVLHRFNEAIAMDYVMPMRVLTPDSRNGALPESSDPLMSVGMSDWTAQMNAMVATQRQDPASMHFLPFPVKYQTLGGEASQLAPFQLLDQGIDTLLNGLDIPVEFYKMTLSAEAAPTAIRFFESVHRSTPNGTNRFLAFLMKKVVSYKDWPAATAKLLSTRMVDDQSKIQPKFALGQAGMVAPQTMLADLDLDAIEELRKTLDFQRQQAELQQEMQESMEESGMQTQLAPPPMAQFMMAQQQAAGGMPAGPGGDPVAGGAAPGGPQDPATAQFAAAAQMPDNVPMDPREITSRADTIATQLLQMPESEKDSRLRSLKQQNETLHAAVKSKLEEKRNQAEAQGRSQFLGKTAGVFAAADRLGIVLPISTNFR